MIFLGVDVGSTGCKCVAFRDNGVQLNVSYREYKTEAGHADMDANEMWDAVSGVIKECAAAVDTAEIKAIGVTSFGESCVALDKDGNALSRFIMYTDKRGMPETQSVIDKIGYDKIMSVTCEKPDPMYSLPKIMWTLNNVDGVRDNVAKFLQVTDFICYRLSGEATVNASMACRTMAYNVETGLWDSELLEAGGISADMLPKVVPCGTAVGTLLPKVAAELGLPSGIAVVNTSQDQIAASVGAGVLDIGQAVDGTGSVECITPVFGSIIRDREFPFHNFVCVPHAEIGKFGTYAFNWAGGVLLKWFRDCFASHLKPIAKERGVSVYRMLDEAFPESTSDVIVVPHHMGAGGTPDMVADAKGTITGMTMHTSLPDIYRATMEGLTFEMAYNAEWLAKFGIAIDSLRATGGGAASPVWLQLKADILGREITPMVTQEAGAAGCAMFCGVAVGAFANLREAAEIFAKTGDTYYPNTNMKSFYADKYEKYKSVRAALLNTWSL